MKGGNKMEPLRFGIVGTGTIARRFAEAVRRVPGAALTAVASRTAARAEAFGDLYEIRHRFGSYEAMAASDAIDAAYIAVPHAGHKPCAMLMMAHGKHVLCEKPMSINLTEAEEMFACAEQNGVLLTEGMWGRLVPGTLRMLELVKSGALGEIRGVEGRFCYAMDADEMDSRLLVNALGGGALLDVGCYGLHFADWYLGHEVAHVSAEADFYHDTDCHTCVLLKYENGAVADLSAATLLKKPNEGYLYGTKGFARLSRFYAPEEIVLERGNGPERIAVPYAGNGFEEQISHFCDCVREGLLESPLLPHSETLRVIALSDRIRQIIGLRYPQDG